MIKLYKIYIDGKNTLIKKKYLHEYDVQNKLKWSKILKWKIPDLQKNFFFQIRKITTAVAFAKYVRENFVVL